MEIPFDYNKIMSDRELFNKTVYTPLSEAVKILEERQKDKELVKKIEDLLGGDIPEPLRKLDRYGINSKQVATPNHDTIWFLKLCEQYDLKSFFYEYLDDKFVSNNSFKHSLGQIRINNGQNKNGEYNLEKITIVDFNKYNGKSLKDVFTLSNKPLIQTHREIFSFLKLNLDNYIFFDGSDWLKKQGGDAKIYYKKDILLYICHGILFENFILSGEDKKFSEEILLPAIENCIKLTGLKPLIVPIPPMDIEEEEFWISYNYKVKEFLIK